MVQNPKGGGLDSSFGGGSSQLGGVQSTNKFLDRTTWTLAISLFALILLSNFVVDRGEGNGSQLKSTDNIDITTPKTDTTTPTNTKGSGDTETDKDSNE